MAYGMPKGKYRTSKFLFLDDRILRNVTFFWVLSERSGKSAFSQIVTVDLFYSKNHGGN